MQQMAAALLQSQMPSVPEWKEIGKDADGNSIFGSVNVRTGAVTPYHVPTATGTPGAPAPGAPDGLPTPPPGVNPAQFRKDLATREAAAATPTAANYLEAGAKVTERQSYKEFSMALPTWNSVPSMLADNSPASVKGLVDAFGKILNPGRAVTTGSMQIIMDTQSIPDKLKGELAQAFEGNGDLSPNARAQMAAIMQDKMSQYQKAWQGDETVDPKTGEKSYGNDRGQAEAIARKTGMDPALIVPQLPDMAKLDLSKISTGKTVAQPNAGALGGPRAGNAGIDPRAVTMLKANPSPQTKAQFDQVFGQGAADRALAQ
jgi:hypothetical protein